MDFEPKALVYSGRCVWKGTEKRANVSGLQALASTTWPDLKPPAELAIMPREDFEIMTADLEGKTYTPHRAAILVSLPKIAAVTPRKRRPWQEWALALFWIGAGFVGTCALAAFADWLAS